MSQSAQGASINAVLARMDRSSPDKLLASLAAEIVRLSRESADLAARLAALEQLQAASDRLLPAGGGEAADELPKNLLVEASHALLDGGGFYPLEFDAQGNSYRWTGPGPQFGLSLFIDRQHGARFRLAFSRFAAQASPSYLRCLVDGRPAEITVHNVASGFEIGGVLPARAGGGATHLAFVVPAMASAAQLGQAGDNRPLGLCFQKLTLRANPAPDADGDAAPRKARRTA